MKNNKLENIGDILLVTVNAQIDGKVQLMSFQDELLNLTASRNVTRDYRTSVDGTFWTEWQTLSNDSLADSQAQVADCSLIIEVRYTRIGSDDTGTIDFIKIEFQGNVESKAFIAPTIEGSIFKDIINEPELKTLANNIFKKLYYRGILPQYITRAENSDLTEDKDFADLWSSVARFFGLFIRFFKRYENFNQDYSLLYEYLKQNGMYFDEGNITLEELQYLTSHFYDQIRQRGTNMIFKRKGDILPDGSVVPIDGEFIRLMRSNVYDELLYEVIPLDKMGWCVGQSSPLWRGTSRSERLNKTKEDTEDFQNLDDFVHNTSGTASIALEEVNNKKVVSMTVGADGIAALGRIDDSQDVSENVYVADSRLDYEITFAFYLENITGGEELSFGVEGFDALKNKLSDAFISLDGAEITELFFNKELTPASIKSGVWYFARGIIHAYSSVTVEGTKTNLGFGQDLTFNNSFVKYILPKIQLKGSTGSSVVYLWDYKIRPLIRGRNILPLRGGSEYSQSLGFIESSRIFYMYVRNNNKSLSEKELSDIINKYLLPFNLNNIFVYLGESSVDEKVVQKEPEPTPAEITIKPSSTIVFTHEGGQAQIQVTSPAPWTVD